MEDASASAARLLSFSAPALSVEVIGKHLARARRDPAAVATAQTVTAPAPAVSAGRLSAGAKSFISACSQSRKNIVDVQSRGAIHGGSHVPVQVLSAPRLLTLGSRTGASLRLKSHQIDGMNWL